jgi:predicted amidohydrolase
MAGENGLVILAGLVERGPGGEAFISHLAAGPEGLLGVYRKIHLGPPEERMFRAGSGVQVFRHRRATFGMELCFDGHFPELSTLLALKGAEVIWIPHASPRESAKEKQERWLRYLSARAYDNGVFLVACNQAGRENCGMTFPGGLLILSPRGEVLASGSTEGEEMVWTDLKASLLKEVRESPHGFFMGRRRPELYKDLVV